MNAIIGWLRYDLLNWLRYDLFNWLLYDDLPKALGLVLLIAACVFTVLYFDRFKRWLATRAERQKMKRWNGSRS